MKFPLRSTLDIGRYVLKQQRKGERYPLVLMLEPTLACNLACIGCGKIRERESAAVLDPRIQHFSESASCLLKC